MTDLHALGRQAVALHSRGKLAEAETLYRQILELDGKVFPALYLLGVLQLGKGSSAAAAGLLARAVAVNPRDPAAWLHYGLALQGEKQFEQAAAAHSRALALQPGLVPALAGRGGALRALGRSAEALADYDAVLAADRRNADAWNGRGALLRTLSRFDEALESMNEALALEPDFAEALQNRGLLLWDEKSDFPAARRDLEKALALEPRRPDLAANLLHLDIMTALGTCDFARSDAIAASLPDRIAAGEIVPPMMLLSLNGDEMLQKQAAETLVAQRYPALPPLWTGTRYGHSRIRLAYISSDFGDHPVGRQVAQLIESHDRAAFEVIAISTGPDDRSDLRRRLSAGFDQFHDVWGRSPSQTAALIRELEVDVLVELNGHTQRGSLDVLRRRPAPVQVSWLGYAGTVGAPFIDVLIADRIVAPDPQAFTERLEYLPDCFFVTDTGRTIGTAPSRSQAGLPEDSIVFCGFNHVMKLGAGSFARWMRILAQVPGSVLWLREPKPAAIENLRRAASAHGIAPERLVFGGHADPQTHLARHALADLFLDILPYNAHATACDALWAGLPVLTCRGGSFAGRVAASLLHAVGLSELVTETPEDYEALAVALARDPARLKTLKDKLAANRSSAALFDTQRFARNLEAVYSRLSG